MCKIYRLSSTSYTLLIDLLGVFDFQTAGQENNAQEMTTGDSGPNIPKGTCDGALLEKLGRLENLAEKGCQYQGREVYGISR